MTGPLIDKTGNSRRPVIGILEAGRPPDPLLSRFGSYPDFFRQWLSPLQVDFRSFAILDGEFPGSPEEADIWLITGSRFAVYEPHAWLPAAEAFIRACRRDARRMVGICFGHQLIARAMGGVVRKSEKGWGLGVHDYEVMAWPDTAEKVPQTLRIQAFHQDQVVEPPQGAQVIAASPFCPHAGLWYPGFAVSFQGHPEFSPDYAEALIEARRGSVLPEDAADLALGTVRSPTDTDPILRLIAAEMNLGALSP